MDENVIPEEKNYNYVQIDLLNDRDWFDEYKPEATSPCFAEDYKDEYEDTEFENPAEFEEELTNDNEEDNKRIGDWGVEGVEPYFLHSIVKILVMLFIAYFVVRFILGAWLAMFVFFVVSAIFISIYVN